MSKWIGLGTKGWLALLLAGSLVLVACGDDDDAEGGDGDGTADAGDETPPGGGGGGGSGSTPTGDAGMMTPPPAPTIPCGETTCAGGLPIPLPIPGLPMACCADPEEGICGMTDMAGMCRPDPVSDDRCPPLVTGLGFDGASCCIEDINECGLVDTLTGSYECTSLTDVMAMLPLPLPLPDPVTCDGVPINPGDGGTEDAGE